MALKARRKHNPVGSQWRYLVAIAVLLCVFAVLIARAAYIQVVQPGQLRHQGDLRSLRAAQTDVQRGMILDRNGRELAVSIPVETVWADPQRIAEQHGFDDMRRWQALAELFRMNSEDLLARVDNPQRRFVYLQRKVTPAEADYVRKLSIPGVYLKTESRRYYPAAEIAAHVVGITNMDGNGQEGLELLFNEQLTGTPGERVYRKDAQGRVVEEVRETAAQQPKQLTLSIDNRLQAAAYTEIKKAVRYHQATSGSAVILDVKTGEVLAMVNSPSFNPNNRDQLQPHRLRNRAITDAYEPGSTVKPLTVLTALEAGLVKPGDSIDTSPGWMRLGGRRVSDPINRGELTISEILEHSSNMGTSKLALKVGIDRLLQTFAEVGFGNDTGVNMPGESFGIMRNQRRWSDFELATLSFGYGLSVTTLQLAKAYSMIANGGIDQPLTIFRRGEGDAPGRRIFSEKNTQAVLAMLENVVTDGSAKKARVPGYRVAGKTGTSRKAVAGGYGDEYVALFAGIAPVSDPRIAVVVTINEPGGDHYYGGDAAAPVFSEIVSESMRLLNIAPDNLADTQLQVASLGGGQ